MYPPTEETFRISRESEDALEPAAAVHRATQRLHTAGHACFKSLVCEYHEGVLTVRGIVPSWYLKQLAQEELMQVEGVNLVINLIEVHYLALSETKQERTLLTYRTQSE